MPNGSSISTTAQPTMALPHPTFGAIEAQDKPYLVSIPFLSEEATESLADLVLGYRSQFFERKDPKSGDILAYELGASCEFDKPFANYERRSAVLSVLFNREFEKIFKPVKKFLGALHRKEVCDLPRASCMGFTIYDSSCNRSGVAMQPSDAFSKVFWPEPFHSPFDFYLVLSQSNIPMEHEGGTIYLKANTLNVTSGYFPHRIAHDTCVSLTNPHVLLTGHGGIGQRSDHCMVFR